MRMLVQALFAATQVEDERRLSLRTARRPRASFKSEGFPAISRWLSDEGATPPANRSDAFGIAFKSTHAQRAPQLALFEHDLWDPRTARTPVKHHSQP